MGISVNKGIAAYAAKGVWHGDMFSARLPDILQYFYSEDEDEGYAEVNGWVVYGYGTPPRVTKDLHRGIFTKGAMCPQYAKKGKHIVALLNQSKDAAGGYLDLTVCGESREAVRDFLDELANHMDLPSYLKIEADVPVVEFL